MTLGIFILILFGSILVVGIIIDVVAKRKERKLYPEDGAKNASESQRLYTENYLQQSRHDINDPFK